MPVNLRELAEESLALRDFAIRRARLSARLDADPQTAYIATGSRGDLQQVLVNLIINAEQALAGATGTIVIRLAAEDGRIAVGVMDEGRGSDLAPPGRMFEPFVTGGDPFETPGLGLWVGRLLVERHGGTLDVEPRATGSAFVMRLPAAGRASVGTAPS